MTNGNFDHPPEYAYPYQAIVIEFDGGKKLGHVIVSFHIRGDYKVMVG